MSHYIPLIYADLITIPYSCVDKLTTIYLIQYKHSHWQHMGTMVSVNIGSSIGVFPDFTKPLPEPMLTDQQWGHVASRV